MDNIAAALTGAALLLTTEGAMGVLAVSQRSPPPEEGQVEWQAVGTPWDAACLVGAVGPGSSTARVASARPPPEPMGPAPGHPVLGEPGTASALGARYPATVRSTDTGRPAGPLPRTGACTGQAGSPGSEVTATTVALVAQEPRRSERESPAVAEPSRIVLLGSGLFLAAIYSKRHRRG